MKILVSLLCLCALHATEQDELQRINSFLIIHDFRGACQQAETSVTKYPKSKALLEAKIQACAKAGDEASMLQAWDKLYSHYPDEIENRNIIENMAWGVLEKGYKSPSPLIRLYSIISAFHGQDARGVRILANGLSDSNILLRSITLQLVSSLRDKILQEQVLRLLKEEKNSNVRLAAIKAAGSMHIFESQSILMKILSDDKSTLEEKAAAIQGIVVMLETCEKEEILKLAKSQRAGLRMLACQLVMHFDKIDELDVIIPLVNDAHPAVRASAIKTLGILRISQHHENNVRKMVFERTKDSDVQVTVMAAWYLTLLGTQDGNLTFQKLLTHPENEIRYLAAAALSSTGSYGLALIQKYFKESTDIYIRMNLAIGLISQRVNVEEAANILAKGLDEKRERWMWNEELSFKILMPSTVAYNELIPNYPEAVNQLTRLEILNMLAILNQPGVEEAVKAFLAEKTWGITGFAAALLLCECDEKAVELVTDLLKDPNQKVRTQAALILAIWGRNEKALATLEEIYPTSARELKEKILESIGAVGAKSTIPFLIERLKEPHQSQRLIAAAALLQTLYH